MFLFRKSTAMPSASDALPGRTTPIPTAERHFVNGHALKGPYPDGIAQAVFGLGCFWGAERLFWKLNGAWVTAVGYAGGFTPNPTYEEVCSGLTGHAEAVLRRLELPYRVVELAAGDGADGGAQRLEIFGKGPAVHRHAGHRCPAFGEAGK